MPSPNPQPGRTEREFGVPFPGQIVDPAKWTQTALKKMPDGRLNWAELGALMARRLAELPPTGWCFPRRRGSGPRRSNYRRNTFEPAAEAAGWPRRPDGRRAWTFHSLRHVFATWALSQPGARIEDVSRLLGHSTVRVTQDLYISADGDLFERFYRATE